MPVPFSRLELTTALPVSNGLMIQSPVSGIVQAMSLSAEPAAAAGFFGEGVQVLLQGTQLKAPFAGVCSRQDEAGQQLRFRHTNGLQLDIHFPPQCFAAHSRGFDWRVKQNAEVTAGQLILNFDPVLLSQWVQPLSCLVTLKQHPRFGTIWCRTGYHEVWRDQLFLIELATTSTPDAA